MPTGICCPSPPNLPCPRALARPPLPDDGTISIAAPKPRIVATCQSVVERRWIVKVISSTWSATSTTWTNTNPGVQAVRHEQQAVQAGDHREDRQGAQRQDRAQLAVVHDHRHDQVEHRRGRRPAAAGRWGSASTRRRRARTRAAAARSRTSRCSRCGPRTAEAAFDQVDDPLVVWPEQDNCRARVLVRRLFEAAQRGVDRPGRRDPRSTRAWNRRLTDSSAVYRFGWP